MGEKQWPGQIDLNTPSMAANEEHIARGLLLAIIPYAPPILIPESLDSSDEDLSPTSCYFGILEG
ncbi:hypothetical protein AMTR_s00030p00234610 [Amborella trichopoda]|uniref:Uncharacterized protein n=1 Tax=Amborella trichopoda TaxID=13333 RepID=U5D1R9_AMBTC|nr:hypothetical protein AMTR_s00030p00234610 [Amborella trichopoda]